MQSNALNFFTPANPTPQQSNSYIIFSVLDLADAKELLRQELIQLSDSNKLKPTSNSRIWLLSASEKPCVLVAHWLEYDYNLNNPKNVNLHQDTNPTHKELIFTSQGWQLNDKGLEDKIVYTINHNSKNEVDNFNAPNFLFEQLEALELYPSLQVLPHPDLASFDYFGYCIQNEKTTVSKENKVFNENHSSQMQEEIKSTKKYEIKQILTCPYSASLLVNAHTVLISQSDQNALLSLQNKLKDDLSIFKNVINQLPNNPNISQITINLEVKAEQLVKFNCLADGIVKIIPNFLAQELSKIIIEKQSEKDLIDEIEEELNCPINFEKLQFPYLLPCGKTCEAKTVKQLVANNSPDPMTGDYSKPLTAADLIPNMLINSFLAVFNKFVDTNADKVSTNYSFNS